MSKQDKQPQHEKPNFLQIIMSIVAAAFGVQSNRNRERDFTGGSLYTYMAAGVIFTGVFVLVMVLIVRVALSGSGL